MVKTATFLALVILVTSLCPCSFAQSLDQSYYQKIVPAANNAKALELQRLETAALNKPEEIDNYYDLAKAFAPTSERVWAIVYAEAYCSHTSDAKRFLEISSLMGKVYESSLIYKSDNNATISFMQVAEIDHASGRVPFEMNFEISIAYGFKDYNRFKNLSIATIHDIRINQLRVWKEKKLPDHGLIDWLQQVSDAGMLEAYDYWLLQNFRPAEYAVWSTKNNVKLSEFLTWRKTHQFDLTKKNFHRLYSISASP